MPRPPPSPLPNSPFPNRALASLSALSELLLGPAYRTLDLLLSLRPIANRHRHRHRHRHRLATAGRVLAAPILLLALLLLLPLTLFGLLLWLPAQAKRRPLVLQARPGAAEPAPWEPRRCRSFTFVSANLCLLPSGLARFSNLGATRRRAEEMGRVLGGGEELEGSGKRRGLLGLRRGGGGRGYGGVGEGGMGEAMEMGDSTAMGSAWSTVDMTSMANPTPMGNAWSTVDTMSMANPTLMANATMMTNPWSTVDATSMANPTPMGNAWSTVDTMSMGNPTAMGNSTPMANTWSTVDSMAMTNPTPMANSAAMGNSTSIGNPWSTVDATPMANSTAMANPTPMTNPWLTVDSMAMTNPTVMANATAMGNSTAMGNPWSTVDAMSMGNSTAMGNPWSTVDAMSMANPTVTGNSTTMGNSTSMTNPTPMTNPWPTVDSASMTNPTPMTNPPPAPPPPPPPHPRPPRPIPLPDPMPPVLTTHVPPDTDFLCLQEVFDCAAASALRRHLGRRFTHVLWGVGPGGLRCGQLKVLGSGLVLASRYPLVAARFWPFPNGAREDALANKGLLVAQVLLRMERGQRVVGYLGCTHLQAPAADATIRDAQLSLSLRWLREFRREQQRPGDLVAFDVLCGDLNFDNCSRGDAQNQQHPLFQEFWDPARLRPGQDQPWAIGTLLDCLKIYEEPVSTPERMERTLSEPQTRQQFLAAPILPCGAPDPQAPEPWRGRRVDTVLVRRDPEVATEVTRFSVITQLATLTDHLPVALSLRLGPADHWPLTTDSDH